MSSYEEIAAQAMATGEQNGILLRYDNNYAVAVCQVCGELPPTWGERWSSDWMTLCHQAMEHAKEAGHFTAVTLSHWAVYGPDPDAETETAPVRTSPDNVLSLADGEIFVFGSNAAGRHGAGAALRAREKFGAVYGVGEGMTGQCYAFPTLTAQLRKRTRSALARSAGQFIAVARAHPELTFLLTKVGCGLAGYPEQEMAALFVHAPSNVIKPEGW